MTEFGSDVKEKHGFHDSQVGERRAEPISNINRENAQAYGINRSKMSGEKTHVCELFCPRLFIF